MINELLFECLKTMKTEDFLFFSLGVKITQKLMSLKDCSIQANKVTKITHVNTLYHIQMCFVTNSKSDTSIYIYNIHKITFDIF